MMIALSLGRSKPFLRVADLVVAACQSQPGGASCRSSRVRNAPLATLGHRSATCRDGPQPASHAARQDGGKPLPGGAGFGCNFVEQLPVRRALAPAFFSLPIPTLRGLVAR